MEKGLKDLIRVMVERADKEKDILMPGYTHLQVSIIPCVMVLAYLTVVGSEDNPSGGPTSSSRTRSRSAQTSSACSSSSLGYPCFRSGPARLRGTPSRWTASS